MASNKQYVQGRINVYC